MTSAVYVALDGKTIFRRDVAESLIVDMREGMEKIRQQAVFGDDTEHEGVLNVYREGIAALSKRLAP